MAFTLTTTHPDGIETTSRPLMYGPQLVALVAAALKEADPRLTEREAVSAGMQVARGQHGRPYIHTGTGLAFCVDVVDALAATPAGPYTDALSA